MGVKKQYLRDQFRLAKFGLDHEDASDFYLSCWQNNYSALPLLCVRLILFLGCIGILVSSLVIAEQEGDIGYWPIYMTSWGLILILLVTGFGFAVSAKAYYGGPIDSNFGLPWYVKGFWMLISIGLTFTFMGSLSYYTLIYESIEDYAPDPILDFFVHGMNSVVMFIMLITSRIPTYFLHVIYIMTFVVIYLIFSIIYYVAGGVSRWGDPYIYETLNWSEPGGAVVFVCVYFLVLTLIHIIPILISLLRDYISLKYVRNSNSTTLSSHNSV